MIFLIEKSVAIETSLSMSKGFLDHNLFHDPNVTTIHCDYPDNRAKDVRISILWPALVANDHTVLFFWITALCFDTANKLAWQDVSLWKLEINSLTRPSPRSAGSLTMVRFRAKFLNLR